MSGVIAARSPAVQRLSGKQGGCGFWNSAGPWALRLRFQVPAVRAGRDRGHSAPWRRLAAAYRGAANSRCVYVCGRRGPRRPVPTQRLDRATERQRDSEYPNAARGRSVAGFPTSKSLWTPRDFRLGLSQPRPHREARPHPAAPSTLSSPAHTRQPRLPRAAPPTPSSPAHTGSPTHIWQPRPHQQPRPHPAAKTRLDRPAWLNDQGVQRAVCAVTQVPSSLPRAPLMDGPRGGRR